MVACQNQKGLLSDLVRPHPACNFLRWYANLVVKNIHLYPQFTNSRSSKQAIVLTFNFIMYYAGREVNRKMPTKRSRCCLKSTPLSEFIISMHSTLSHPLPLTDSSRHPGKMRSIAKKKKKKTVKFSSNAKLRSFAANGNDLQTHSSWLTSEDSPQ